MPAIKEVREAGNPTKVIVTTHPCVVCNKSSEVKLDKDKFTRWINGEFAQNVWPEMSPGEREVLVSGTHDACWEQLMGDDDG
jgi:hypothetical protein